MNKKGQALIEFILILPIILIILVYLIDIGNIFVQKYNLNNSLETISELYQNKKLKEVHAYVAKEELNFEETNANDLITLKLTKKIKTNAPGLSKILGKNYKIETSKTIYKENQNE
ncbi:MAG: pilus assembly protein [Bacilli bacterium]|nr:pilus assembly protein [Bacilli bacterium]